MAFCEQHHGMAAASQALHHGMVHDAVEPQDGAMRDPEVGKTFASARTLCSACCVNASLAADSAGTVALAPHGTARIPFLDVPASGVVSGQLDAPPLVPAR